MSKFIKIFLLLCAAAGVGLYFNIGRNLKWRAAAGFDRKLSEVKILHNGDGESADSFGNPDLSGFKYKKKIRIKPSSAAAALFNYQIKVTIAESQSREDASVYCEGNVLADFRDVRFTYLDRGVSIPYYINKVIGEKPNRTAEVFIKVCQIPAQGLDVYIYYGNPAAIDHSNPEEVFDFYDDFSESILDKEKWIIYKRSDGNISLTDSAVVLDNAVVISKNFKFSDGILEFAAESKAGCETMAIVRGQDIKADEEDFSHIVYASDYVGAQHCIAVGDIVKANVSKQIMVGMEYKYKVIAQGDKITFERYVRGGDEREAEISYEGLKGPCEGYLALKAEGISKGKTVTAYKWVRVRKYINPEPKAFEESGSALEM